MRTIDISNHSKPFDEALKRMRKAENQPCVITDDKLSEFIFYIVDNNTHVLHEKAHHSIIDGRSHSKFDDMIINAYNNLKQGKPIVILPELHFDALAQADLAYKASVEHKQDEKFWKDRVQSLKHHAYTQRNVDSLLNKITNRYTHSLSISERQKLQQIAAEMHIPESILYIGVSKLLFRSLHGNEYVSLSLPVSGTYLRRELGMTSNIVPLLLCIPDYATLKEVFMNVAQETKSVLAHQRYRIEEILRHANFGPHINVMLRDNRQEFENCSSTHHFGTNIDTNELQITFWSERPNGRLDIMFDDIVEGHSKEQLVALKDRFNFILALVVSAPNTTVATLNERCRAVSTNEQNESFYANRRTPVAAGFLQWGRCVDSLVRLVNSKTWVGSGPSPFATSKVLLIDRAVSISGLKRVNDMNIRTEAPGTLLAIDENAWHVAVADGVVKISDFLDESGRATSARILANQCHLLAGDLLPVITPEQAEFLGATYAQVMLSNPHWSHCLANFELCKLSIVQNYANQPPVWAASDFQDLSPVRFSATELIAAWLIYIARHTQMSQLQIGWDATESNEIYQNDDVLATRIFAETVPFSTSIDFSETFSSVVANVERDCKEMVNNLPCLSDLIVRHAICSSNDLRSDRHWELAVSLINTQEECPSKDAHGSLLTLQINKNNGSFRWIYDNNKISEEEVNRISSHLLVLLASAHSIDQSQKPIGRLNLLPKAERELLLNIWNQTDITYPAKKCIHQLFEEQVRRDGSAIAVECEGETLNYDELNTQSNQLAHYLISKGVKPDDRIALCVKRSTKMIVAILGILKAGGAYVPLDPEYNSERLRNILRDADPMCLLADSTGQKALGDHHVSVVNLDHMLPNGLSSDNPDFSKLGLTSSHLAYIIYTSGSTGRPKGVMVEHHSLLNLVQSLAFIFDITLKSRFLQYASCCFDNSVGEILTTLTSGACLCIPNEIVRRMDNSLIRYMNDEKITHAPLPPAIFRNTQKLIDSTGLKTLILGGETPSLSLLKTAVRHTAVFNGYGPTETTIAATTWSCPIDFDSHSIPIGRPISNNRIYLLNAQGEPVPLGAEGELYIGGAGVARGYLNRSELTAECFLSDPFSDKPSERMYRTGDLARYLPDGNLVFLGRIDQQVKIRGFRIEPGEIEAHLVEHPLVREAVVQPWKNGIDSDTRLVAYVVANPDASLANNLRTYLKSLLPDYMVPAAYVCLSSLPLTPNGKLDRRALPAPDDEAFAHQLYEEPRGEMEEKLAEIWSELLGIKRISRNDNFFALGGHSLLIVRMVALLRKAGLDTSVKKIFDAPTLFALAETLGKHQSLSIPPNMITEDSTKITPDILPLISLSQSEIDFLVEHVPGGIANIQDIYGLAPLQEGILFHHMMAEQGDPYLRMRHLQFSDREKLDDYAIALKRVIERHDILRTAFIWEGLSEPAQIVLRQVPPILTEVTLDETNESVLEQLNSRFNPRHYKLDLTQAPLLRVFAAQTSEDNWVAMILMHHLITDHTTLERVNVEVQAIIEGQSEQLATPTPFRHVVAQAQLGVSQTEHTKFFEEMLADVDTPTLPFDLSDVHGDGTEIDEVHLELPQELNNQLREHALHLHVSLASLCHLAWAQVLAKASGHKTVVFGTVLSGRLHSGENDSSLGLMINTLPIRLDIDERTVESAVRHTHFRLSALLEHDNASLALAQRCSGVPASLPLFNALLNYRHNQPSREVTTTIHGVSFLGAEERTNYPINLAVEDDSEALTLTAQVVSPISAARICGYMQQALLTLSYVLTHTPQQPLRTLTVMPPEEHDMLLHSWNRTTVDYPPVCCLHQLFEAQVERSGQAIAVEFEGETLSYAELNAQANRLAHHLITRGVKPDDLIAICVKRSTKMIVAILGILKAGAAYVPLDPVYSSQRLRNILVDADPLYLLADSTGQEALGVHDIPVINLDQPLPDDLSTQNSDACILGLNPNHLAYVIYTSGSTGTPKGVMVEHQSLFNLAHTQTSIFGITPKSRILQFASCSFDVSMDEIMRALTNGACLCILNEEIRHSDTALLDFLSTEKITHATLPPALFRNTKALTNLKDIQTLEFVGEPPSLSLLQAAANETKVFNGYGPTETTNCATNWICPINFNSPSIPIGRPISNVQIYLLDSRGEPVPLGAEGELYIGGAGVTRGYLKKPELTTERFLPDTFSENPTALMYRTGDLARYLPDGNLVYLGRTDQQVKIRGFRIEPGEIEARLVEHPLVREAAVQLLKDGPDSNNNLVAYVVADPDASLANNLRTYLATLLPDYMVPAAYVCLSSLPLTPNGKLDRRALPTPDDEAFARQLYEEPRGELEEKLAAIWSELLGIERISRNDNFFALGGHSLMVMKFSNLAKKYYNIHVDARGLFSFPILKDLAERITNSPNKLYCDEAIPVRHRGDQIPIFFLPDGYGDISYAFELAHEIDESVPVYVLPWFSPEKEQPSSVVEMANTMISLMKKVLPDGPCAIAGYSSGGILAYEIANQLINSGYPVSFLGLIDTSPLTKTSDTNWFLYSITLKSAFFKTLNDIEWWERVSKLRLNEAIEEVKLKNVDLKNADIEWEALLSKQRAHYHNICAGYKINSLPITVNLLKASEFDQSHGRNMYFAKNIQTQKSVGDFSKMYNFPKIEWDSNHLSDVRIIPVNGGHFTMMTDQNNRTLLGKKITELLLSK
ncbi:uncharacterized protein LOC116348076 [Contarinia nasturtii]|uniref:uncharacterized protein LOC116348076 n=1 Tax=Contarinia nasturtii TaxID=265458 RepID=UPI0012D4593D|nr:uncharacterized protein LOC116348076 [Contarinia nasturtii]